MDILNDTLVQTLYELIEKYEYELVEFKEASNGYNNDRIGKYFSAISNEANLKNQQYGWLIFGVKDKDRSIVGTDYRNTQGLNKLKQEISNGTTEGITFIDIFEVYVDVNSAKKRAVMFKIPAAPLLMPVSWNGHHYGRNGESLSPLNIQEIEEIRDKRRLDWSKQILKSAKIENLDKEAIMIARQRYKEKIKDIPNSAVEIDAMSDLQFLTKIKLVINNEITNACMLLLGNSDFDYMFDNKPEIMWRLYGERGQDKDYEIFTIPYISVVDKVYSKIRNLKYRYMPSQLSLITIETDQYDPLLIRELLNNCIAHQDYTVGGRIYINECEDSNLKVTNPGSFLPSSIDAVLEPGYAPPFYRNQLLADVMTKFNMIDTVSMGIRRIFNIQKAKFFPLPDYDISNFNGVSVTVYGKVLDENYTKLLYENQDIELSIIFLLDKVQKKIKIEKNQADELRKLGFIEGRYPNIFVSDKIAEIVNKKDSYIHNKAFDDSYYQDLIMEYLKKFKKASKNEIVDLLKDKLSNTLDEQQKVNKVKYLLKKMKNDNLIQVDAENKRIANWIIR